MILRSGVSLPRGEQRTRQQYNTHSTRNAQADLAQNTLHSPVQNKENLTVQQETRSASHYNQCGKTQHT